MSETEPEMVVRVMVGMCADEFGGCQYPDCSCDRFDFDQAFRRARAAIAAMRVPTEEMAEAASRGSWIPEARKAWRRMIDAALSGKAKR